MKHEPLRTRSVTALIALSVALTALGTEHAAAEEGDIADGTYFVTPNPGIEDDAYGISQVDPRAGEDSAEGVTFVQPGNPENSDEGIATGLNGADGETSFADTPDDDDDPDHETGETAPDLTQDQLLAIGDLEQRSAEQIAIRIEPRFQVPAYVSGSWAAPTTQNARTQAIRFMSRYESLFRVGDRDALEYVAEKSSPLGITNVRLQQKYSGLPVFGAELMVHIKEGAQSDQVLFVNGTFVPDIDVDTTPQISAQQARSIAVQDLRAQHPGVQITGVSQPRSYIYNTGVLQRFLPAESHLAWGFTVSTNRPTGRSKYMIDGHDGTILRTWSESPTSHPSRVYDAQLTTVTTDDDLWFQDGTQLIAGTPPSDVDYLEAYGDNYYDYLYASFGIDSIDDSGSRMVGRALYNMPYNACWNCIAGETVFGSGMATQDIVGHEFTHGLVQYLGGGLTYSDQSGALNESYADIFGEYLDCDTSCNWLMGQDAFGNVSALGVFRSLADPTLYGDPDHMDDYSDGAGVHSNSGIPNKMAYLMAAGGSHRGMSVGALGLAKAADVLYNTLVNVGLTSSATFYEFGDVLNETCTLMSGAGLTDGDCANVRKACRAVGICSLTQGVAFAVTEQDDRFGYSLAAGDFNGDGREDLAIGSPYEDLYGDNNVGSVIVFYGDDYGLTSIGSEYLTQADAGTTEEANDRFGYSLTAGDLDADGKDDLVVGTPYEHLGTVNDAGWIFAFYGSADGLLSAAGTASYERLSQTSAGTSRETYDLFGYSLATGDLNADGYDDVVVGTPYEDLDALTDAGWIIVFDGGPSGLLSAGTASWERLSQSSAGTSRETGDLFGFDVAIGDLNGDNFDDVVAGAPGEDLDGLNSAGWIIVFDGSPSGLLSGGGASWERLSQSSADTSREAGDQFGYSVTVTDLNNDGYQDAVAGAPYEDLSGFADAGWIIDFQGGSAGLLSGGSARWERLSQTSAGTDREAGDLFGYSLTSGDREGDGYDDVLIGTPYEDLGSLSDAGWVILFRGSPGGLLDAGAASVARLSQSSMAGVREASDLMGRAVTLGDFDGDGDDEIAAGSPYEDVPPTDAGAVFTD